jgi:hypothetical protein
MKAEFSGHIFEKYSNVKFHENPSSGNRVVPRGDKQTDRRTDGHEEANSLLNFAEAPKKLVSASG